MDNSNDLLEGNINYISQNPTKINLDKKKKGYKLK